MNKKIILTFDYELSLGRNSGTALKCIIEPTDYILDLFKKYNGKGIFFVDAAYLLTLYKHNHRDLEIIKKQIHKIINSGSNVELHLHPQWLDAYPIDRDRWGFKDFKRYRLHSLSDEQIKGLFKESIKIIENIIHEDNKNYKITAFRAGGWSIQPFDRLKQYFLENKIIFDFSVTPGIFSDCDLDSFYDFRNAPIDLDYWRFEDDPCVKNDSGRFTEIPISTIKDYKLNLWINYFLFRSKEIEYNDGKAISTNSKSLLLFNKLFKLVKMFSRYYSSFAIDGLSHKYFLKYLKKLNKREIEYITAICHPKKISKSGIKNLEYLLKNYETIGIQELGFE